MRPIRLMALFAALALAVVACSSGSEEPETTTTAAPTTTVATTTTTTTSAPTTTTTTTTPGTETTTPPKTDSSGDTMESPGDDSPTIGETETTTPPETNSADVCEAPNVDLTLEEQRAACDEFVWSWLLEMNSSRTAPILFLDHQHQVSESGESTTLLLRFRSYTNTKEQILAQREAIRELTLVRFGFPESWIDEEALAAMEAQIDANIAEAVQRAIAIRAHWFGLIAFAYASYAELLGIDTIVLQIATADATTDSGWSTVIYGVDAASVVDASPGTLGDFVEAISVRDSSTFGTAFAVIFDLFQEVELPVRQ